MAWLSILLVSVLPLLGLGFYKKGLRFARYLSSLAAGVMLGDVFFHILPELYSTSENVEIIGISVVSSIIFAIVLEIIFKWHHSHDNEEESSHQHHALIWNNLLADGIHNFLDGAIIMSAYSVNFRLGLVTTVAVILHEIPQELGDLGVLLLAGLNIKKAILFNLGCALSALLGAALVSIWQINRLTQDILLAFTAGLFINIALSDLLPILKKQKTTKTQILMLFVTIIGTGIMLAYKIIE